MPLFRNQYAATAICMLCMAAVTQVSIIPFIIIMEMIDGSEMVISLMAVALIAAIAVRLFSPPLYATLVDLHLTRMQNTKVSTLVWEVYATLYFVY